MVASHAFGPLMIAGSTALAIWALNRFDRRRPRDLRRAVAHVVVGYCAVHAVMPAVRLCAAGLPHPVAVVAGIALVTVPALTYLFLGWLWLLACVRDLMMRPRGGHPVRVPGS